MLRLAGLPGGLCKCTKTALTSPSKSNISPTTPQILIEQVCLGGVAGPSCGCLPKEDPLIRVH